MLLKIRQRSCPTSYSFEALGHPTISASSGAFACAVFIERGTFMAKSGQKPSQADSGGQRSKTSKEGRNMDHGEPSNIDKGSGTGTPQAKPKVPSSGSSGAKKG